MNMRKCLIITLLALSCALGAAAQVRLGYVDVRQVYRGMPEMEDAKQQFEATSLQYQKELEDMRSEFQRKYTEYQSLNADPRVSDAIKERRLQEIQTLDRSIQEFLATVTTQLNDYEQQILRPVIARVIDAVRQVGQENGFTIIYGDLSPQKLSGAQTPGLEPIYMSPDVIDVTPLVLTKLGIGQPPVEEPAVEPEP